MPSKRSGSFVRHALKNFREQTYQQKELVIIRAWDNDPKPTMPPSWMDELRYNERVVWVPPGLSIGELRNVACREARGSVIAHWDDDDWSHPTRLALSMDAIDGGAMLVGSSRVIFRREDYSSVETYLFDGGELKPKYLVGGMLVYRRELWEARNFRDVEMGEDTRWQWEQRGSEWPEKWVDLADENLYTATISPDATSPKDTESPGWRKIE